MSHRIWQKLSRPFKDFDAATALLYLCQRALARVPLGLNVVKYLLIAQPVPPPPDKRRPHNLRIEQVSAQDYQDGWFPRPRHIIESRYQQQSICFVAFDAQTPLACLWLKVDGDYDEDTVRCRFRPLPDRQTAWDFDVFVHPEYRLGRTFMHLWAHAAEWMRERDIRWTMSRIDAFNLPSINSHRRLGARITGSVVFWTWGAWQLSLASQTPRVALSRTGIPTYTIHAPSDG